MLFLQRMIKKVDNQLNGFWQSYYMVTSAMGDSFIANEVSEMRNIWKDTFRIYKQYNEKITSRMSWIKSFIPGTDEFHLRYELARGIKKTSLLLSDATVVTNILKRRLTVVTASTLNNPLLINTNKQDLAPSWHKTSLPSSYKNVRGYLFKMSELLPKKSNSVIQKQTLEKLNLNIRKCTF